MTLMNIKGVNLDVLCLPGGAGSPLVFLHEGLGSIAIWQSRTGFWPAMVCRATGRTGVVYSRRGYGQSDPVPDVRGAGRLQPDYMHREAWEVLPALLARLEIRKPVLIGHSDGGSIALLYASRQPPLEACVVMAPHLMVEDLSIRAIEQARVAFEAGSLRERLTRYHANVDCAFWQWNDVWLDPAFRAFDIQPECRNITAPVLAIQGLDDAYGSLRHIDEIAPTQGIVHTKKLTDCGHSAYRDQPGLTVQLVADFLAELSP